MTSRTTDDSASEGARRIAWAGRSMPALWAIADRQALEGSLHGLRVGIANVLEPTTANLALALERAGAVVSVHAVAAETMPSVANALSEMGIGVFADLAGDEASDLAAARAFLEWCPQILIDDGARSIRLAHAEFPDLIPTMMGAAEVTTSGVRPLRQMASEGALSLPVIAINDAPTKHLFDNAYGTGQSCVMALLDVTNLQLAGRVVVVLGYGYVGTGVARNAAALGARVVVCELDPIKALQAHYDGHRVSSLAEIAPEAEVVFASTGVPGAVSPAHLASLKDGAILCTPGGGSAELPMEHLREHGARQDVRPHVAEYRLPDGKHVLVIAEGDWINLMAAEGNPIEVMDLSMSVQSLAAEAIAVGPKDRPPGVYLLPKEMEETIARIRIAHERASIETLTPELAAAMRQW